MNIEPTQIEVVVKTKGFKLTLSEEEARLVLGSIGRVKTTEVADFVNAERGYKIDEVENKMYKLFNAFNNVVK